MDDEILAKLREAENTLAGLKALVETSSENGEVEPEGEPLVKRYMELSVIKLIETRGKEVFHISDTVGLYFIVPNNRVRTSARSSVLRIVRISAEYRTSNHPPAFIQVGDWVYPLMEGSMVYRSEYKYYLFPDLLSSSPGTSVGVVLPKSCSQQQREQFENIILELVGLQEFPLQPPESFGRPTDLILSARTSVTLVRTASGVYSTRNSQTQQGYGKRIGDGFKAGGQILSRGIELGAIGTSKAIDLGTTYLKSALAKEEHNREIPSSIVDGAMYASDITGKALVISSSILAGVTAITANLASLTACYIKSSTAPLIATAIESSGVSQTTIDEITTEIRDVGAGIVGGSLEVYSGMESAGNVLAKALHNNTVEIISHCYGPPAADVLNRAGEVIGNVALAGMNAGQAISPANIVFNTTGQTGLALAIDKCESGR